MSSRLGGSAAGRSSTNGSGPLTSAVSSLVRAQYGLSSREDKGESGTDLDKHVAELLLKEAKEREARAKANNTTAWFFSDDEDGSGKQFTSRTNKRFLKSMLKGVEEHNAPLRRKEESPVGATVKESLDAIRKREREARERRTGVKDSDRPHAVASSSASPAHVEASGSAGDGERRRAPGFAARALAMGFSGAVAGARDSRKRDLNGDKSAVEDARSRATGRESRNGSSTEERGTARDKGKARATSEEAEDHLDRRREREASDEEYKNYRPNRPSRRDSLDSSSRRKSERQDGQYDRDGYDETSRFRRRSHSKDRLEARTTSSRRDEEEHHPRHSRDRDRDRDLDRDLKIDSGRHHDRKPDDTARGRAHSLDAYDDEPNGNRSRRRRSPSQQSDSDSEHSSDAPSDTFIDYTGAIDGAGATAGGSKMDKYFSPTYNPALDVSFQDLEDPKTGLIAEGNYAGWDQMLSVLKKRKEDKVSGVSREREEERERQLRKMERRKRREEREARRALKKEKKRKRRRRHSSDEDESDSGSSVGPKEREGSQVKRSREPQKVVIDGFEYGGKGSTRAWDLGKNGL